MNINTAFKLDVGWSVIFKIALGVGLIYFLFLIKNILLLALIALVVSIIFNPAVSYFEKKRLPRVMAGILVYAGFLFLVVGVFYAIFPSIVSETVSFSQNFNEYYLRYSNNISKLGLNSFNLADFLKNNPGIGNNILNFSGVILKFISSFFNVFVSIVTIFVLAFFFSIETSDFVKILRSFSPKKLEEDILKSWQKSQEQVMGWFGGRIISCIAVAIMTFIACFALHIKFTVSVSILCGILNLVPLIGPILASLILFSLGLLNSWTIACLILIISIIIQFTENNFLTPFISNKIIGIPNFLILLSILIGGQLLGAVGAILAIPLGAVIYETLKNYIAYKKNQE